MGAGCVVGVGFAFASEVGDAEVQVDSDRFLQVLANLLSNATKFSPKGSSVGVRLIARGPRLRVEVENEGPEIPMEFRSRIFQRFAQADASDTRRPGGTGLGLSISKALVEQMGGTIGFRSDPRRTCFHVEFPEHRIGRGVPSNTA